MALIKLESACLAYGHVPLLDKVDLQIDAGERVCLVGRNGAGKSTLMRVLEGVAELDEGGLWKKPDLRVACLSQEVPQLDDLSVYDVVAEGLDKIGKVIADYHHVLHEMETDHSEAIGNKLGRLQDEIEEVELDGGIYLSEEDKDYVRGLKKEVKVSCSILADINLAELHSPRNN